MRPGGHKPEPLLTCSQVSMLARPMPGRRRRHLGYMGGRVRACTGAKRIATRPGVSLAEVPEGHGAPLKVRTPVGTHALWPALFQNDRLALRRADTRSRSCESARATVGVVMTRYETTDCHVSRGAVLRATLKHFASVGRLTYGRFDALAHRTAKAPECPAISTGGACSATSR